MLNLKTLQISIYDLLLTYLKLAHQAAVLMAYTWSSIWIVSSQNPNLDCSSMDDFSISVH